MPSSLQQQVQSLNNDNDGSVHSGSSRDVEAAKASATFRSHSSRGSWRGGGSSLRGRSSQSLSQRGRFGGRSSWSVPTDDVPVCKFFLQNRCTAGMSCRFRHSQEATSRLRPSQYVPHYGVPMATTTYEPKSIPQPQSFEEYKPKREYCPVAAAALQHAKVLQDKEERNYENLEGPFYSIDVEAIASGYGHNPKLHRIPGRIAMVDDQDNVLVDEIVKYDPKDVVSYLTPLTGLSKLLCSSEKAKPLEEVVALVRERLPKDAVLVGQCK